jgi:hypothetical protein
MRRAGNRGGHDPGAEAAPGSLWHALSLLQPLATLATCGRVDRLRMAWGTSHRGPLLIHAASLWDGDVRRICNRQPFRAELIGLGYGRDNPLPVGGFVGVVTINDCTLINEFDDDERVESGTWNFFRGERWGLRYDWGIGDPRMLARPLRSAGTKAIPIPNVAIFPVPIDVGAEVAARSVAAPMRPIEWPESLGTMIDIASSYYKARNNESCHPGPVGRR